MNETEEFLNKLETEAGNHSATGAKMVSDCQAVPVSQARPSDTDDTQWAALSNGGFRACGPTQEGLPPAVYGIDTDQFGNIIFATKRIITDELVILPDTASERVLLAIQLFWKARGKFKALGQLFKRGVMLWGPPGSGKTTTIMLLTKDIIERGGVVVLASHPELTTRALEQLRRIEPERPAICILEDIDELVDRYGEHGILALLDGENQVDNVVFIATTNYPERLDQRLVNRPSRFDEIIKIGMPTADARAVYLRSRLVVAEMGADDLRRWVADTDGLSVAHLRELVVAVFCLDRDYEETLTRLKSMSRAIKSDSGRNQIGMTAKG
jgi:AAA+ superfamily predicted ATPase